MSRISRWGEDWTAWELAELGRLRARGDSWREVAEALGRSRNATAQAGYRYGVGVGARGRGGANNIGVYRWTGGRLERAIEALLAGATIERAAAAVGASRGALAHALCARGLRVAELRRRAAT